MALPLNEISTPMKASNLVPEVVHNFGHPLPKKYDLLLHQFVSMEKIVSIAHGRNMRLTFENLAKNVMRNTKINFGEIHLAQIIGVYSQAYELKWEKNRGAIGKLNTSFSLIITPNFKNDIQNFMMAASPLKQIKEEPKPAVEYLSSPTKLISPVKQRPQRDYIPKSPMKTQNSPFRRLSFLDNAPKLDGSRLASRKMIFRHLLVLKFQEAHKNFLATKELKLPTDSKIHPEFKEDEVPDLVEGKLPKMPQVNPQLNTIKDYLQSVKKDPNENCTPLPKTVEPKKEMQRLKKKNVLAEFSSPEKVRLATQNGDKSLPLSPKKLVEQKKANPPKLTLLERIRAREAAKLAVKKGPEYEKMEAKKCSLEQLKHSMLEVICSHFTLNKVNGMNLRKLHSLVSVSCGQIEFEKFTDCVEALCEVAPKYCSQTIPSSTTSNNSTCLRISEVRVDKLMECVNAELQQIENKKLLLF